MDNILITGQCSLHWGRMEFGNIGNFYIMEPLIRELHRVFPNTNIKTTFQMSETFQTREDIEVLPMELYYSWKENELELALQELASAEIYSESGYLPFETNYINQVLDSDLVIDFSGDIWGDNANLLGDNRFLVGLIKDRVAQLLGKKTAMIAGSPGPFHNQSTTAFAKKVFSNFDLVTNRESLSLNVLKEHGFNTNSTHSLSCPAFLFEPSNFDAELEFERQGVPNDKRKNIGFTICGWNFTEGPFDKEKRSDNEFDVFIDAIDYIVNDLNANVILMSHSNGFPIPPESFELQYGRDYKIIKQLQSILEKKGLSKHVYSLDGVYSAWDTKKIVSNFDMFVSGRVHGAIAGVSQYVPTVFIDYGHEPKAHKIQGFAIEANAERYLADPAQNQSLIQKIKLCWNELDEYKLMLENHIPKVQNRAKKHFDLLSSL